ncbi:uncharacterized protein LOC126661058 isoform X2 [Mercurialis annua]|uniref:uncharacterized protein LOC126661058 isoform X2 n=1 Tax=Mercurialis annua TaxID=3986 RepID=UPI0021604CE5|nr:uncharacterized protein LOC126661058 isoform X2 [Mercurialis annua]
MGSSKKDEKLDCPIIIVIKGNYSTKKSQIANKIASFLQYPLTDEGDIILSLQNSISNLSSSKYYNKDLVFQIVRQISSTQIKLKLNIVVNTELSQYSHFEDLAQLAASEEASLLIIGCDAEQNGGHLYDIGNVPKLNVDPSKPFIAEEFVPAMLQSLQDY